MYPLFVISLSVAMIIACQVNFPIIGTSSGPRLSVDQVYIGEQMCVHVEDQWHRAKAQVLCGGCQ